VVAANMYWALIVRVAESRQALVDRYDVPQVDREHYLFLAS